MPKKSDKSYIEKIQAQRQEREDRFKNTERGWLGLVGLYRLRDGENRVGSDKSNDIVLPPEMPGHIGIVQYNNGVATFRAAPRIPVYCNGTKVTLKTLTADIHEDADFLQVGDFTMVLLERGDRHLIRIWNKHSQLRKNFTGFNQYKIDPKYCIEADYISYDEPKLLRIQDVIEIYHEVPFQGFVTIKFDGVEYRLEATGGEDYLFFSFKDQTNGETTYIGGRYLVSDLPKNGKVTLDFNLAYNPPCAYTDFATCPLPPTQNHLGIRIEAGEKIYHNKQTL